MTTITEKLPTPSNPMGISGLEFIEFATSKPLALGALLSQFGFVATARHRSREVVLYQHLASRHPLNIVVNAAPSITGQAAPEVPSLSAIALRVANAANAHATACQLGAWDIPSRARAMELNIPGIHGVGDSVIYFVDRYAENAGAVGAAGAGAGAGAVGTASAAGHADFASNRALSIYDVDFIPLPRDPLPSNTATSASDISQFSHFFGIVQAVHAERSDDWIDFYRHLFGFTVKADERQIGTKGIINAYDGVLPKGVVLTSPCKTFHLQLIEPPTGADDIVWEEGLIRLGIGSPDVLRLTQHLQQMGVHFVDVGSVKPSAKGALSHTYLGGVTIELVHSEQ